MLVKINKLPKSEVEMEIEVPAEDFDCFFEQATLDLGKDLEIKGFRKGKVPKQIIEEHFGPEKVLIEAAELAVKENYRKAILENNIEAITQPKIEIKKLARGNEFIFSAKTAVLPELELPDYKKIASKVERRKITVEEKEIEDALKWLQGSRAKFSLKNGPSQKGDFVEIEYQLPQEKQARKDAFILGQGHFIPGFEEKIVGMQAGRENKIDNIKVKLTSVQKVEFPEINDQFAQSLGNFKNLATLKENIREGLNLEKEQVERFRWRNEVLEKISEKTKVEIPDVLVEEEKKQMLENMKKNVVENLKISFEDYLVKIRKTEKEILDTLLTQVKKRIKNFLILREIGKRELDLEEIKKYTKEEEKIEKIFQLLEQL